ncbi:hypothetical protein PVAP13_5KG491407 [Panicum virgatum]|uniref:Uncharacterized protein n=2 Tax=Panicum virgatum TaxID=38727 RepID=A0A8T0STB7_PANVG|nr:hypothetical protein PVAP13_5KG491407 [Panicum virgatum]
MGRPTVLSGILGWTPALGNGLPNSQGSHRLPTTEREKSQAIPIPFRPAIPIASAPRRRRREAIAAAEMGVMGRLRIFVVQEPVVAASCLIAGFGLFLPAVVRPILDSFETAKQVPQPALSDVVAGVTGKK